MTQPNNPSPLRGGLRSPFSPRTGAILLMVAGAVGFVAARLMFGDQVLCLLGSTLVVFLGLGLLIAARRNSPAGDEAGGAPNNQRPLPHPGSGASLRAMPRGLRAAGRQPSAQTPETPRTNPRRPGENPTGTPRTLPVQSTENPPQTPRTEPIPANQRPDYQWPVHTEPLMPQSPAPQPQPAAGDDLLDAVITTFENQGARVDIETQREERGILTIQAPDGMQYTSLVLSAPGPVEVAEVRALYALMSTSGSVGGYLISAGGFSQRAYDWASQHRIRLVAADEIDELGI